MLSRTTRTVQVTPAGQVFAGLAGRVLSELPWSQIARMRGHLAHRYFGTDHAILQATVDNDLPDLERAVEIPTETRPAEDRQGEGPPAK